MNLPNLLTLSRIPLLFIIAGLLYCPATGAATGALIIFAIAGITDYLDGYYARKMNLVSNFGKLMDALTDKVLMVGLFITFLAVDILPGWAIIGVLLILCREFLITGLRLVAASSGIVLAAEKAGKQKTVTQIISAALLLAAPATQRDWAFLLGDATAPLAEYLHTGGLAVFVLCVVLTIHSGTKYMVKYWKVFTGEQTGPEL